MKIWHFTAAIALSACLGGCGASLPGMSTGSLFGGKKEDPAVQNSPESRAFQVASTSARAIKCGYNFDATKLRYQYLASEAAASPADQAKASQVYDLTFSGVTKTIAGEGADYCSSDKTRGIKDDLNRHLAGDYTPTPTQRSAEVDGLFSGMSSSSSSSSYKATLPMDNNR